MVGLEQCRGATVWVRSVWIVVSEDRHCCRRRSGRGLRGVYRGRKENGMKFGLWLLTKRKDMFVVKWVNCIEIK